MVNDDDRPSGAVTDAYALFFNYNATASELYEEGAPSSNLRKRHGFLRQKPAVGTWTSLTFDLSFVNRSPRATANGIDVFDGAVTLDPPAANGQVVMRIGAVNAYDPNGASLNIDNVVFDRR